MTAAGAFSWQSELPSGHNPFWIRDEALAGLGLHPGDAVSVDTRAEPRDGDVVVVEVEHEGDSLRTARRLVDLGDRVRLEPVGGPAEPIEVPPESVIVMGVVVARLRLDGPEGAPTEEPLGGPG
jgi:SOS-response transcriptional repressor LexA